MPSLRVCHVISSFSPIIGGTERATENLCRELLKQGVDTVLLTRRYPGLNDFEEVAGIPVHRLGYPRSSKLGALTFAFHAIWLLMTRLRGYHIIHVQNRDTPLLIGLVCKVLLRRSVVATIQGETMLTKQRRTRLGRVRLKFMWLLVDRFGAISPEMQRQIQEAGVPGSRVRLIPNGTDMNTFRPPDAAEKHKSRLRLNLPESDLVVLFVGRLVGLKRVDLLLKAWSRLPSGEPRMLLIVGDGPERQALEMTVADLHLENVRFDGATDVVASYLQAADIFVLPSQQEGLSVALLEAMASGLCVVVASLPGNQALVQAGKTGLIFTVNDLDSLVDQLTVAVQSPALRQQLGRNARQSASEGPHSLQAVAEAYRKLYEELLPRTGGYVPSRYRRADRD